MINGDLYVYLKEQGVDCFAVNDPTFEYKGVCYECRLYMFTNKDEIINTLLSKKRKIAISQLENRVYSILYKPGIFIRYAITNDPSEEKVEEIFQSRKIINAVLELEV